MWFHGNHKKLANYPSIVADGVNLKIMDKQKYLGVLNFPGLIKYPMFVKRWHTVLFSPNHFTQVDFGCSI